MMALKLNTAPTVEPIDLAKAKTHLRIDLDDEGENQLIEDYIEAARLECERFQNRSYITQTWELWLDNWPGSGTIELKRPPVQSVTSVKYYDTSDTEATFSSDDYFVDTKDQYSPRLVLGYGKSWPSTTLRPANGVCVTYVTGYGDSGDDVPGNLKSAVLLMLGHFYENREAVIAGGGGATEMPLGVKALLSLERVY